MDSKRSVVLEEESRRVDTRNEIVDFKHARDASGLLPIISPN